MKRNYPYYINYIQHNKVEHGVQVLEAVGEITKDAFTVLTKLTRPNEISYQVEKGLLEHEYWWMTKPANRSTQEKYESLKYEFLNWVDQTFER